MSRTLTLYSRPACHLCDVLLDQAVPIATEYGYGIEKVNIDEDQQLFERYRLDIPVLVRGDREICRHHLDEHALRNALKD